MNLYTFRTRDRRRYLRWVFEAKKRFGLCVLDYAVTSNHIHLWSKFMAWRSFKVQVFKVRLKREKGNCRVRSCAGMKLGVFGEKNGSSTFREMRSKILN
jgi:hypothetical protein